MNKVRGLSKEKKKTGEEAKIFCKRGTDCYRTPTKKGPEQRRPEEEIKVT